MTKAANCLNLGDLDDVDVLAAVEKAFAVKISKEESRRCETVGQLFAIVSTKLGTAEARRPGCPTTVAFFRLRAALRRLGYQQRMTTATDLRAIFHAHGAKRLHAELTREADLRLPDLSLHPRSVAVLALVIACGFGLAMWTASWVPFVACATLAIALAFILPRTIAEGIAHFGDFAVDCAAWNYGALSAQCGGVRPRDLWQALTIVVREVSGTGFKGEMNRDTRFFPKRPSRSRPAASA